MSLHIVTRCTRQDPKWVAAVRESLKSLTIDYRFVLVGPYADNATTDDYIQCECPPNDYGCLLNRYLETFPDDGQWVYVLDDDNILHPGFEEAFKSASPDCCLFVGSQQVTADHVRVANPARLTVQNVDFAQHCSRRDLIGDLRLWSIYRNDGYFLEELVIRAREAGRPIKVLQQVMSFYNAQRWLT